jgi:hypothetical protein
MFQMPAAPFDPSASFIVQNWPANWALNGMRLGHGTIFDHGAVPAAMLENLYMTGRIRYALPDEVPLDGSQPVGSRPSRLAQRGDLDLATSPTG